MHKSTQIHEAFIGHVRQRLYSALTGCSETGTVGAQSVSTCAFQFGCTQWSSGHFYGCVSGGENNANGAYRSTRRQRAVESGWVKIEGLCVVGVLELICMG